MQHLDVSSFLGPASMVERRIGSTTRRRGVYGGEFLQQGFAYKQSGGREEGSRATRVWRKVCKGRGRTSPLYIEGVVAASPSPSSKPISSLNDLNSLGSAGPYGALCPWPNAARTLPHRPMPPPGRWGHVGPLPEGSRSFRYNTD